MRVRHQSRLFMHLASICLLASTSVQSRQIAERPGAPRDPIVTVNANHVVLRWLEPSTGGSVVYYLIQVGSIPGAIDLGIFNVGPLTAVSASAPSGRYFVRVLAVNAYGTSPPSPEVTVDVGPNPAPVPTLHCVAFGPYIDGYSPLTGPHPPPAVIDALVGRIATETDVNCLMTFGVLNGLDYTFEAARRRGLRVIAIVWLEGNQAIDLASIELGIVRARQYPETIVRIACGSELRTRRGAAVAEQTIADCVSRFRAAGVSQPIGTNDTWWSLCDESRPCRALSSIAALDWIGVNVYPWWENRFSGLFPCIPATEAPAFVLARLQDVRAVYPGKDVILTEFGWPAGPDGYRETNERTGAPGCGIASRANQQLVITQTVALLRQFNLPHVVFEAFSEPWKIVEGPVGPWWGVLGDMPPPPPPMRVEFTAISRGSPADPSTCGGAAFQRDGATFYSDRGCRIGAARGFNVAAISGTTGELLGSVRNFDTWYDGASAARSMVQFLDGQVNGTLLLIAVGDEAGLTIGRTSGCPRDPPPGSTCCQPLGGDFEVLRQRVESLGARRIRSYCYWNSYSLIVTKGTGIHDEQLGRAVEAVSRYRLVPQ